MSCTIFRSVITNIASVRKIDFSLVAFTFEGDAGSMELPFTVSFHVTRESTS